MKEARPPGRTVRFGVFEVNLQARELRKCGVRLKLHEKPFQILELLLERVGELVARKELREKLWPNTIVGFDPAINTAINTLRRVLGDSARNPRFVETRAGRGYRFIAPVRAGEIMLAVLPFENLGGDPEQGYFRDGLFEEIITQLVRLHPRCLGIIARSLAMHYKGTKKGIDQIGQELGVDYILDGTVRRAADRVRVSAQLVHVSDKTQLWSESYELKLTDAFVMQREISTRIGHSLGIELFSTPKSLLVPTPIGNPSDSGETLSNTEFLGPAN